MVPGIQNVALLPPAGLFLPCTLSCFSDFSFYLLSSSSHPYVLLHPFPHVYLFCPLSPFLLFPSCLHSSSSAFFSLIQPFSSGLEVKVKEHRLQSSAEIHIVFPCRPNGSGTMTLFTLFISPTNEKKGPIKMEPVK